MSDEPNMIKYFVFLALLTCSSFFIADAFSVEIELLKESDSIIDTRGWLKLDEKLTFQEQIQIIIDQENKKNRISVMLSSTNPDDIIVLTELESAILIPEVKSIVFTNEFDCAKGKPREACIIVLVETQISNHLPEMIDHTRGIADKVVEQGILGFTKIEFHSNTIIPKPSTSSNVQSGDQEMVFGKVIYTLKNQGTKKMFNAFTPLLLHEKIWQSGGFFDYAEKLSENYFTEFVLSYVKNEQMGESQIIRVFSTSLICSNDLDVLHGGQLPRCLSAETYDEVENGKISPLEFLAIEDISRSKLFTEEFLPLNSVIQVIIYPEQNSQVTNVNSNLITKLSGIGDVQDNGWFFVSKSGKQIDGRYLFGTESSVSKNELVFSFGPYRGDDTEIGEGGGCLIATATFDSELSPQVQFLREIRDGKVMTTQSGSAFMNGFNQFYYSFSPAIADYERENTYFKEAVKITITPLLTSLTLLNYVDIDSEHEILGYGIGVILLNIGMYFVAPAILIIKIKKLI